MDLAARFRRVACSIKIPISAMLKGWRYRIEHANKGDDNIVNLTLGRDDTEVLFVISLPGCYSDIVTDVDIAEINSGMCLYIMYRGFCAYRDIPLLEISRPSCQPFCQ
jgi:hypothetical protein